MENIKGPALLLTVKVIKVRRSEMLDFFRTLTAFQ
jgi:hypothetical protein